MKKETKYWRNRYSHTSEHSKDYKKLGYRNRHDMMKRLNFIISLIEKSIPKDSNILDAGCGNGLYMKKLNDSGYSRITGVDLSLKLLSTAHNSYQHSRFIQGDVGSLPFRDNSFDSSLITGVLQICSDPLRVLREMRRVTDQTIILSTLNSSFFLFRLKQLFSIFLKKPQSRKFTAEELKKLFSNAGLKVKKFHKLSIIPVSFFPRFVEKLGEKLSLDFLIQVYVFVLEPEN